MTATANKPNSHTPAPWTITSSNLYGRPCIRRNGIIVAYLADNTSGLALQADRDRVAETDRANAQLISNAPDLLEFCEMLLIHIRANGREVSSANVAAMIALIQRAGGTA